MSLGTSIRQLVIGRLRSGARLARLIGERHHRDVPSVTAVTDTAPVIMHTEPTHTHQPEGTMTDKKIQPKQTDKVSKKSEQDRETDRKAARKTLGARHP